jgi:hypothetical protein
VGLTVGIYKEYEEYCERCHERPIVSECDYCGAWICEDCAAPAGETGFFYTVWYCKSCYEKRVVRLFAWPGEKK